MDVIPKNYDLIFEPDLSKFTFEGKETIKIVSKKPANLISLDCAEIKIHKCTVKNNGKEINSKTTIDEKSEKLKISLKEKIKGDLEIYLEFQGILNDRLLGFYRSQYRQGSKTKYLATTQFEAADARRAFPCWDEPKAKATFDISIIADNKFSAISNMPIKSKIKMKNKTLYKFSRTPIMSTYLIYLGVGEFEYLNGRIGKIQIRVVTTKGNKSKGKYSLELGKKIA